jgi:hypothetical protein
VRAGSVTAGVVLAVAAAGCGGNVNAALQQLSEARRLSAELLVEFTKADDAANRAVMADTDEASVAFAKEADESKQAVQKDLDALAPLIDHLGYADEGHLLTEFTARFGQYRDLDRNILDLAVQNTNLKAQRLSFGPAQAAAEAFRSALDGLEAADRKDTWQVRALASQAELGLSQIEILQPPHIADADDQVMSRLEARMAASESAARRTLATLQPLVAAASRPQLAAAAMELDRFMTINTQIVGLSRQNTNVRSLILSLNQKRPLVDSCEESLRALQNALAKRGYHVGRWPQD